jgi:Protein of unknown function (DUF742)
VLREKPPMPVKCVTRGLLFRTSNDLDWHIREEHLQRATPPAKGAPVAAPAPVWSVARTRPTGRRHTRTAGTSQTRPQGSLPLARGGAGCSADGHRNPRRSRVAEGLARDPCPGRRSSSAARRCGPLGVIRVLVGDMADEHLVMVHRPAQAGDRPDLALLERVLYGLHTI